jgi:hypothetical protein
VSPRVELDDLVTGAELARRIGVSTQRVHQLRTEDGFPVPVGKVGKAIVWRWRDVETWAKKTGRL